MTIFKRVLIKEIKFLYVEIGTVVSFVSIDFICFEIFFKLGEPEEDLFSFSFEILSVFTELFSSLEGIQFSICSDEIYNITLKIIFFKL